MIYNKDDVISELNEVLVGLLNVKIVDVDRRLVEDSNIRSAALFHYFKKLDFVATGGEDIKEFYIIFENDTFTIQITELTIEEELSL